MQMAVHAPVALGALAYSDTYGISWVRGQFRVASHSPLRASTRSAAQLLVLYTEPHPLPPTPEEVETLLLEIEQTVPARDIISFTVQAVILRATAREYYAR